MKGSTASLPLTSPWSLSLLLSFLLGQYLPKSSNALATRRLWLQTIARKLSWHKDFSFFLENGTGSWRAQKFIRHGGVERMIFLQEWIHLPQCSWGSSHNWVLRWGNCCLRPSNLFPQLPEPWGWFLLPWGSDHRLSWWASDPRANWMLLWWRSPDRTWLSIRVCVWPGGLRDTANPWNIHISGSTVTPKLSMVATLDGALLDQSSLTSAVGTFGAPRRRRLSSALRTWVGWGWATAMPEWSVNWAPRDQEEIKTVSTSFN